MSEATLAPDVRAGLALRRVAAIALLSVLLGFLVQGLILAVLLTGRPWGTGLVVNLLGGVTWSLFVCVGVGIAAALGAGRALLTGVLAAFVAPLSLAVAKGSQKVMAGWLGAAESQAVLSLGTASALRAVEYGLLGWFLGRLAQAGRAGPWPYLRVGAGLGFGFGGGVVLLTWWAARARGAPLDGVGLAAVVVNEMVFPLGCAVVVFLGQEAGRALKLAGQAQA